MATLPVGVGVVDKQIKRLAEYADLRGVPWQMTTKPKATKTKPYKRRHTHTCAEQILTCAVCDSELVARQYRCPPGQVNDNCRVAVQRRQSVLRSVSAWL